MHSEMTGCWIAIVIFGGYNLALSAMFLNYKLKLDKTTIELKKNDEKQNNNGKEHYKKICELERENFKEKEEIHKLNNLVNIQSEKITLLEGIIENLKQSKPANNNIPKSEERQQPSNKPTKPNWKSVHDEIKKRRKDIEPDDN